MPLPPSHPPSDPELSALLRAWEVPSDPPHGLSVAIWRRIEAHRPAGPAATALDLWDSLTAWLDRRLRQPLTAGACLLLILFAGFAAGAAHGHASTSALTAGLQDRYVQSIDPFALRSP